MGPLSSRSLDVFSDDEFVRQDDLDWDNVPEHKPDILHLGSSKPGERSKKKRIQTGRSFQCGQCHQRFSRKFYLTAHMLVHSGEKPFACNECGQGFLTKYHLGRHMRTHTGEKPYQCSICDQRFSQKYNLTYYHMPTHTGERPVECEFCLKRFPSRSSLTAHRKTHEGKTRSSAKNAKT